MKAMLVIILKLSKGFYFYFLILRYKVLNESLRIKLKVFTTAIEDARRSKSQDNFFSKNIILHDTPYPIFRDWSTPCIVNKKKTGTPHVCILDFSVASDYCSFYILFVRTKKADT